MKGPCFPETYKLGTVINRPTNEQVSMWLLNEMQGSRDHGNSLMHVCGPREWFSMCYVSFFLSFFLTFHFLFPFYKTGHIYFFCVKGWACYVHTEAGG